MNANAKRLQRLASVTVLVSLLLTSATTAAAGNAKPTVFSPKSHPYGMTYSEWGARWWQWVIGSAVSPNSDATGALCGTGQTGRVWLLAGATGGGTYTRNCSVPSGRAIFLPVAYIGYIIEPWVPNDTVEVANAANKAYMDQYANISAEVDGVAVENLESYRVQSPADPTAVFDVRPSGNTLPMTADGIYVMLAPLPAGEHTIHFHSEFPWRVPMDVTYNITVQNVQ